MSSREQCPECPRSFATRGGLATHRRRSHAQETTQVVPAAPTTQVVRKNTSTGDFSHDLTMLAYERAQVDALIRQKVGSARKAGTSWTEIGLCLGVTKQAARQRYGL